MEINYYYVQQHGLLWRVYEKSFDPFDPDDGYLDSEWESEEKAIQHRELINEAKKRKVAEQERIRNEMPKERRDAIDDAQTKLIENSLEEKTGRKMWKRDKEKKSFFKRIFS